MHARDANLLHRLDTYLQVSTTDTAMHARDANLLHRLDMYLQVSTTATAAHAGYGNLLHRHDTYLPAFMWTQQCVHGGAMRNSDC